MRLSVTLVSSWHYSVALDNTNAHTHPSITVITLKRLLSRSNGLQTYITYVATTEIRDLDGDSPCRDWARRTLIYAFICYTSLTAPSYLLNYVGGGGHWLAGHVPLYTCMSAAPAKSTCARHQLNSKNRTRRRVELSWVVPRQTGHAVRNISELRLRLRFHTGLGVDFKGY